MFGSRDVLRVNAGREGVYRVKFVRRVGLISKHENLKPIESQTKWQAKQLHLKSIDFRTNGIPFPFPIGLLSLETSAASMASFSK